jgi:hypothetical protein
MPNEDHRKRLERLRDRLEGAIEGAADRELAPLAARYQAVLAELAAMPAEEANGLDDLSAARRRRRAAAAGS